MKKIGNRYQSFQQMKEKEIALEEERRNREEALSSGISLSERNTTFYDAIHYYLKTFKYNKIKAKTYDFLRMKEEIIRKNPASPDTPTGLPVVWSITILVFLMKNKNL